MKHYWINIDSSVKRKEFMEKQFNDLNIENYRISALTPEDINFSKIIKNKDANSSPGEYATIISHLKAIKAGYDSGDEYFMILEDDMYVENIDDNKLLNIIEENSDNETIEMIQIYNNSHPFIIKMYNEEFLKNNKIIIKRTDNIPSAGYYLLTRKGAKKILDKFVLENNEYDLSISSWCCADNILFICSNTYIFTYPFIIGCSDFESHLHNDHIKYHKMANNVISNIHSINNCKDLLI